MTVNNTNTLAICQLFHSRIHGDGNSGDVDGHFLALHTYDKEYDDSPYAFLDFWTTSGNMDEQNCERDAINRMRQALLTCDDMPGRTVVANVRELTKIPNVDIVETIELDSGHMVAIKKTVWLSIFQRMLKNRYAKSSCRSTKRARR